ncbi:MAG: CDP-alcohol phosphatidyltransferase family protein [Dehalococcoidia bacterium]|nr:MAG: CDP-alcohol phosphatidyltransferase family protein [Dehalococcoidia bacterium]
MAKTPVSPNSLTLFNLMLASGSVALLVTANFLAAGILILVAGFLDMLDGALARHTNRITHFGAILDSTIDRLAEGFILLGILYFYANEGSVIGILLTGSVLLISFSVSYIKSRAEAAGIECSVGLFTRPERVIVLAIGLLINQLDISLYIIGIFSLFTFGQRLVYTRQQIIKNNWRK